MSMNRQDIMEGITSLEELLPLLRDKLGLRQKDLAAIIGVSRQSIIDLEHKNRKITRAIFIALTAFFSLHMETARVLYEKNFYKLNCVSSLGFSCVLIKKMYDIG